MLGAFSVHLISTFKKHHLLRRLVEPVIKSGLLDVWTLYNSKEHNVLETGSVCEEHKLLGHNAV
jgi:hypothetical protein